MRQGAYRTPLGDVSIDESFAEAVAGRCPFLEEDAWSQRGEHSIETLLPFLQRLGPADLMLVPIVIGSDNESELVQLACALAQVSRMFEEPVLLIASSDLSHYESQPVGRARDRALLDAMASLDGATFVATVRAQRVVMCGYGAVACVLDAAKQLGASQLNEVAYSTSAQAGGDPHSTIGYAGVIIQ